MKRFFLLPLFVILAAQATPPQHAPPRYAPKVQAVIEAQRALEIKADQALLPKVSEILTKIENARITDHPDPSGKAITYATAKAKANALKNARDAVQLVAAELAGLRDNTITPFPPIPATAAADDLGLLPDFTVLQVQDDHNALIHLSKQPGDGASDVWLTGVATAGWADDQHRGLDSPLILEGTRQYITVTGAQRTVLVAAPLKPESNAPARAQPGS